MLRLTLPLAAFKEHWPLKLAMISAKSSLSLSDSASIHDCLVAVSIFVEELTNSFKTWPNVFLLMLSN